MLIEQTRVGEYMGVQFPVGGATLLHFASALGYDGALRELIAHGVNINHTDSTGFTALHWAAAYGRCN